MKRSTLYYLLILGFVLKGAGASWDASYHFKHFRQLTQWPHIIIIVGHILVFCLFIYMWRHDGRRQRMPLKIMGVGFFMFFLSLPLDELWHRRFGIDLTTWSPSHLGLFYGTVIVILGIIAQLVVDERQGKVSHSLRTRFQLVFFAFLLEAIWFPLIQQEQGVIAIYFLDHGGLHISDDLLRMIGNARRAIVGGVPDALYSAYAAFTATFVFRLIKSFKLPMFSATIIATLYVSFRMITDSLYAISDYPRSTVPYFLIACGLLFDFCFAVITEKKLSSLRNFLSWASIVVIVYGLALITTEFPLHPAVPVEALDGIIFGTLCGYIVARLTYLFAVKEKIVLAKTKVF